MDANSRFPWWIPAGALLLAAGYLPSLNTPFDFTDDGNLVYASPQTTLAGHVDVWWDKVRANYEHLGPFRPTLWVHWQLQANLFDGDPFLWRLYRLLWSGLAAGMLLWLFRELGIHPMAALMAGALAMWNPYRNEIWTSLTLAEGVAMPYALFALVAARKAARSNRPSKWEIASVLAVLVALGCKNVFAALVPAQIALRMWPEGITLREAWRKNGFRSLALGVTLIMPIIHFVYFKMHWHPGQYETQSPSFAQFGRLLNSLKGAMSLDFMGLGLVVSLLCLWNARRRQNSVEASNPPSEVSRRPALLCAALLLVAGIVVYLPMAIISGRYTMPGVWGLDILVGMLLTSLVSVPDGIWKKAAWTGVCAGLAVVMVANVGRQEKFAARARMLWDAALYVEATAPPGTRIAWMSGDSLKGGLNVEEGIHFQWHLHNRGRTDLSVGLFNEQGQPLERVELPPLAGPATFALIGDAKAGPPEAWDNRQTFAVAYWFGRRRYDCHLSQKRPTLFVAEAAFKEQLRDQLLRDLNP